MGALGEGGVDRIDRKARLPREVISRALSLVLVALALVASIASPTSAAVTTLYVDRNSPACSEKGGGTQAVPYCTINAAAQAAVAGQTVLVNTGTYPESVTVEELRHGLRPDRDLGRPGCLGRGRRRRDPHARLHALGEVLRHDPRVHGDVHHG